MSGPHSTTSLARLADTARNDFQSARMAAQNVRSPNRQSLWDQKRLLAFRKAVWTKPMGWLRAVHGVIASVGEGTLPSVCKLVILSLSRPIVKAHDFCFERAYSLLILQFRLAGLDQQAEQGELHLRELRFCDGSGESLNRLNRFLDAAVSDSRAQFHVASSRIAELDECLSGTRAESIQDPSA